MAAINVTLDTFEDEVLKSDKPVVADFWASWCGPCKMLSPVVDQVADEVSDVKVVKINVDENEPIAIKYNVASIPCLVRFVNGEETNRSVGVITKPQVEKFVKGE